MLPEDIDDLFRQKLDGHATPPGDDLWARLQLPADDKEPLDTLFQAGLKTHATPPRRELWERLEDEHLRPQPRRKRRVAAWWQYSAAAVLLLMLLAGGAGLWRGGYLGQTSGNIATTKSGNSTGPDARDSQPTGTPQAKLPATSERDEQLALSQSQPTDAPPSGASPEKNQKYFSSQATAPHTSTSSTPIATTTRPRRTATTLQVAGSHRAQSQQPDAAAGQLASNEGRKTSPGQYLGSSQVAPATTVAPATRGDKAEAPTLALAPSLAKADASFDVIEVDVRRGPEASRSVAPAVVAVAEVNPTPTRRPRLRLGGLLRQADHLVHGEGVNLAEATGLAESVTLQARLGGRLVSKTIQL